MSNKFNNSSLENSEKLFPALPLFKAAKEGDIKAFEALLSNTPIENLANFEGLMDFSSLIATAGKSEKGREVGIEIIKLMINKLSSENPDLLHTDSYSTGVPSLFQLITLKMLDVVEHLLNADPRCSEQSYKFLGKEMGAAEYAQKCGFNEEQLTRLTAALQKAKQEAATLQSVARVPDNRIRGC